MVLALESRAQAILVRAAGSLDLSEVRPVLLAPTRMEAVLQLKEVLDRIHLPPAEDIPDSQVVSASGLTRWRIPHTSIDIVQVTEGPRAGEFLFNPNTVRRAYALYQQVKQLPYLTAGTEGFYEHYISNPGSLLAPKWLAWVVELPPWAQHLYYGQTVWQWSALALILFALFFALYAVSRWQRRRAGPKSDVGRVLRRLVVPSAAVLGLWFASYFLDQQISFSGQGLAIVLKLLLVPERLLESYIVYLILILIAEQIIRSPRIDDASLDANMIRMSARIVGMALGLVLIFYGADKLGVPLVPLLASLGVGGIAVALATRPTLENLIGGIILYIDKPVRVGDFCGFGIHEGTVERIGVRSTQVRARDRTVITVPNATFADMQIVNWARCDRMQILSTIGLLYQTKPEQLRYVLAMLREMFVAHPKIHNDPRIRFVGYGSSSLDIQIRVYALTREWDEFFAIQEDVLLRVGEIVEEAGTSFAFPSRTLYMARDNGLDEARSTAARRQVQSWRNAEQLPFPNMALARREHLTDTLDYPPDGSPGTSTSQGRDFPATEPLSTEANGRGAAAEPKRT